MRATTNSMITERTTHRMKLPVTGLSFASVGLDEGSRPRTSDAENACRTEYAIRTPRNGRAVEIPNSSYSKYVEHDELVYKRSKEKLTLRR
jgi:hypothetical protein